jgi:hypothetical protein
MGPEVVEQGDPGSGQQGRAVVEGPAGLAPPAYGSIKAGRSRNGKFSFFSFFHF